MPPFSQHDSPTLRSSSHHLSLRAFTPSLPHFTAPFLLSSSSPPTKTRTLQPLARTLTNLLRRQSQVNPSILPTTYSGINDGPAPGVVVGIVFGSVAGFLLLLWLIYTCFGLGEYQSGLYEEETVVRRHSRLSRSPRRAASSRSRSEVIEVTRHRSPPRREIRRETEIVHETRRAPAPPPPEDDIVEVIEEHSPDREPRRTSSRRESGYYRHVDPDQYEGGRGPVRKVSRR